MKLALQLCIILLLAIGAAAQTETIVANAFPVSLVTPDGSRQYGYAAGTLGGQSLIAAAYSNGQFGAVLILTPGGSVLASTAPDNLLGIRPEVALRDIDADGNAEVVVTMNQPRGLPATWIYRFASNTLTLLGPFRASAELPETDLADAQFVRADSTNRLAVLDHHSASWTDDDGTEHVTATRMLYTWGSNGFGAGGRVDLVATVQRGTTAPQPSAYSFVVDGVPTSRSLLLINGDTDGAHRAASAVVSLNNHQVIGERDLNQTIASVRVPITLDQATNQLTVVLKSDPGARVTVLILP